MYLGLVDYDFFRFMALVGHGTLMDWTRFRQTFSFSTYQWFKVFFSFGFNHSLFCLHLLWSYLISFFIPKPSASLQLGLWSRPCLKLSLRGTPLSCTATWLVTPLQRSSGGMLKSTEPTPSSSCGMGPASVGYLSTQLTAPMGSVCLASRASHWRTLGRTSAGPATTPGAMTSDKTLPSPGSAPRPPFRCYRVSGLCPVVHR